MDIAKIKEVCDTGRNKCKVLELKCRDLVKDKNVFLDGTESFEGQQGEIKAHLMLAVRHLEDARMRLGKAIQYSDDGISCYDRR